MTKDEPNLHRDQTSRKVGVKPNRNGNATDERLHDCERRRWKRGREERGSQEKETARAQPRMDDALMTSRTDIATAQPGESANGNSANVHRHMN